MSNLEQTLNRLAAKARQLYSLPTVAMRVLELTNNPQVDVAALKECIENDPALTTKVLRVVNSSLFGLSREVSDLGQALALLGTKPLKLLVLGFSLPSGLFGGMAAQILGWYWRRTLTKAVAAREISERIWRQAGDEAFIAGLLQDLGMLLLIQELGDPYLRFLDKVRSEGHELISLETAAMGFDHTTLTSVLLKQWGMPDTLVEAVGLQPRDPESVETPNRLRHLVRLAELVTTVLIDGRSEMLNVLLTVGQGEYGLTAAQFSDLVETLEQKVTQLADVLSLQLPQQRDYRDLLAQAHSQLSDVAASVTEDLLRSRQGIAPPEEPGRLVPEVETLSAAFSKLSIYPNDAPPTATEAPPPKPSEPDSEPATLPLRTTSTPVDPALLGHLATATAACRQSRCPLSLMLVELSRANELMITHGAEGYANLQRFLANACRGIDHRYAFSLPHGDAGFSIILPDCDRPTAVRLGHRLLDQVPKMAGGRATGHRRAVCLAIGIATVSLPPKNFPAYDLVLAADRCLYGSHSSGGSVVKSIEIY